MVGREKSGEGKEQFMIQSTTSCVKQGGGSVMARVYMAVNGTGSLLFTDDVTTDRKHLDEF